MLLYARLLSLERVAFTCMYIQAATAGRNGDKVAKRKYDQISGALIVAGIVFQVIGPIIITGSIVVSRLR